MQFITQKITRRRKQGMILMTDTPEGKLAFVEPAEKMRNGTLISQ